jgi:hypothetical protein
MKIRFFIEKECGPVNIRIKSSVMNFLLSYC